MIKKAIIASAIVGLGLVANAEGYQVNTFSARQQGMGQTGVSQILGAESLIFNPAALASMPGQASVSASFSGIASSVTATHNGNEYKTDNKVSTPFNVSAAFRINERMAAGITIYTPYGSSINWGLNWPGAVLNQSVDLKVISIQPAFSWKITDKFSVGAGVSISWGSVNLNKGLVASSSLDALIGLMNTAQGTQYPTFGNVSPANVNLTGTANLAAGFNVGVLYEIDSKWKVGASFRSKFDMKVKSGDVEVSYANAVAQGILGEKLNNLNSTNFAASMPCPYVLTAGVSWKPSSRVLLAFDAQLNGWKAYKQLDMEFAEQEQFNQHLLKDYHNAMTYHMGVEVNATRRLDVRAGLMIDTSPCNTEHYNPETPAATKIEPSVGLSFRPVNGLEVNLSLMYVQGTKVTGTGLFDDFIAPIYNASLSQFDAAMTQMTGKPSGLTALPQTGSFTADYKVHAFVPGIGVSYTF